MQHQKNSEEINTYAQPDCEVVETSANHDIMLIEASITVNNFGPTNDISIGDEEEGANTHRASLWDEE